MDARGCNRIRHKKCQENVRLRSGMHGGHALFRTRREGSSIGVCRSSQKLKHTAILGRPRISYHLRSRKAYDADATLSCITRTEYNQALTLATKRSCRNHVRAVDDTTQHLTRYKHGQQNRCPHRVTTGSFTPSRQMLHSKYESSPEQGTWGDGMGGGKVPMVSDRPDGVRHFRAGEEGMAQY